jgi:hypothetical protein
VVEVAAAVLLALDQEGPLMLVVQVEVDQLLPFLALQ